MGIECQIAGSRFAFLQFDMTVRWLRHTVFIGLIALIASAQPVVVSASELLSATQPRIGPSATASHDPNRPDEWAVTVLGGWLNEANFSGVLFSPWTSSFDDTRIISAAISKRVHEFDESSFVGQYWFVELEAGIGQRFGNSDATEIWTALYLKFDGFPWSDIILTTAGVSTGINYVSSISDLEVSKSGNDKGSNLLHYFSPEIAFADPDRKNLEFVARLHHRSGIFGLFDGVSGGSTFLSLGLRQHF